LIEVVLKSYLAPGKARDDLFSGGTPPLGTFSARINVARALHLIREDEYELLHLIRRIRNEFAHNPDAAFTDDRISSWLAALPERKTESDAKSKFTLCSVELIAALEADAVHEANGRVHEESFNTFYRRGCDHDAPPFNSAGEAAATYKAGRS
jgi:DNA-binding MltR family transcriptional regulator